MATELDFDPLLHLKHMRLRAPEDSFTRQALTWAIGELEQRKALASAALAELASLQGVLDDHLCRISALEKTILVRWVPLGELPPGTQVRLSPEDRGARFVQAVHREFDPAAGRTKVSVVVLTQEAGGSTTSHSYFGGKLVIPVA